MFKMRKIFCFVVVFFMIFSSISNVFAEEKISIRITDTNGVEKKVDEPIEAGDDFIIEYTIQPDDVEVNNNKDANVDITFVMDLSGSMKYVDAEMTYEVFKEKYATKYTDFETWKKECLENEGNIYRVKNWSNSGNIFKGVDDPKLLEYYNKYFMDKFYFNAYVEGIDNHANDAIYNEKNWYTESELKQRYTKEVFFDGSATEGFEIKNETRLDAEKRAINNFLDSLSQMNNLNAKISLVGFNFDVTVNKDQLTVDVAKKIVNEMTATGITNSGQGLLTGYYNNIKNNIKSDKYVIYISDGATTSALLKKNGVIIGEDLIDESKVVYHLDESDDYILFNQKSNNEYDYYVEYEIGDNNNVETKDNYNFGYNVARRYIYAVASELYNSPNSKIDKTYVVGIGDQKYSSQKDENKRVCGLANGIYRIINDDKIESIVDDSEKELNKLYFPLSNASELSDAFTEIINDIANSVKTEEGKVQIPFLTNVKFNKNVVGQIPDDLAIINDVVVEEIKGGQAVKLNSDFSIVEKNEGGKKVFSLEGKLIDGFTYNYDEKSNKYKANPIKIKVYMSVPKNYIKDGIEINEGGSLDYTISKEKKVVKLPGKSIAVKPDIVDLVNATLTIDEVAKTTVLNIVPLEKLDKISVEYENGNLVGNDAFFLNKTPSDNLTYNISQATVQELSKTGKLILNIEKTVNGTKTNYKEIVNVLVSDGISYNSDRYGINYPKYEHDEKVSIERYVGFRIKAAEGLEKINFRYSDLSSESTPPVFDGCYEEKMLLKDVDYLISKGIVGGKNSVEAKYINKSKNTTILKTAVLVKAKGPELENIRVIGKKLFADISNASENLSIVTIKMYNLDGTHAKNVAAVVTADKRGLVAEIGDTKDFKVEIDAIDINNNGTITKADISLESGIYNKFNNTFMEESTKVIIGMGYTFAIDFNYTGTGKIEFEAEGIEADGSRAIIGTNVMKGFTLKNVETGATYNKGFNFANNGNKITIVNDGTVAAGKYRLIFSINFKNPQSRVVLKDIITRVTYNGVSEKKYPISLLPLLQ